MKASRSALMKWLARSLVKCIPMGEAVSDFAVEVLPVVSNDVYEWWKGDKNAEERRKELAKLCGQYAEKARIAVRNVRRDGMEHLKADEKKHEIGEDERKRLEQDVQKLTDETIKQIDEASASKEKEILGK